MMEAMKSLKAKEKVLAQPIWGCDARITRWTKIMLTMKRIMTPAATKI